MRKSLITLWIILLSVLFSACLFPLKKVRIDNETKEYCLFDQDSYWIYQDSISLEIDSIIICKPIGHSTGENGDIDYEYYYTLVASYSQDSTSKSQLFLSTEYAIYKENISALELEKASFNKFYYHSGEIKKTYNFLSSNRITLLMKKNNCSINGINFYDIKVFESLRQTQKEIYYWAKDVGLIRVEKYDNKDSLLSVRNLIRYNVKPYKQ